MFPYATALAKQISKPLIAFDLEHTGGKDRGITEFGATILTADGNVREFSSLVKPKPGTHFNPFVTRLTGIYPRTVKAAPAWKTVLDDFVLMNQDALWIGFNSGVSDMPTIRKESAAVGVDASVLHHLDIMRIGDLKGSLTARVSQLWPEICVDGAHRALADSRFTMLLLEGLLARGEQIGRAILDGRYCISQNVPDPDATPAPTRRVPRIPFDGSFLTRAGECRRGQPWTESEKLWVVAQFKKGKTPIQMAALTGRNAFAVAYRLFSEQVIDEVTRDSFANM